MTLPMPAANLFVGPAVLVRWVDGDTLLVDRDLGHDVWARNVRLRLGNQDKTRHVYAPETDAVGGRAALDYVRRRFPPGTLLVVQTFSTHPDTFTRFVAEVWNRYTGENIGDVLVAEGWASRTAP